MARKYNQLKLETLSAFSESGPLSPGRLAGKIRLYPIRAAYSYLSRLWRWGLLSRREGARGRLLYSLSARGRARLAWLIERERKRLPRSRRQSGGI